MNSLIDCIKKTKYNIGFVEDDLQDVLDGKPITVNWLRHSFKDRWFADPFILDISDKEIFVLVEEWSDNIKRGRISKLTIDRKTYELKHLKVMIDEGYHMSFPSIERIGKDVYVYPESSVVGRLESFKYDKSNDRFDKVGIVCDLPLTDSVVNNMFGHRFLFSTCLPDANGKDLGIYLWDEKKGRFLMMSSFHFQENLSRMAGNFFRCQNKIYRPAQVCIKSYGDAVSIQEVTCSKGKWDFKELRRIYSPHPDLNLGFHTFNTYQDLIVVDAIGYRRAKLCKLLRKIKNGGINARLFD